MLKNSTILVTGGTGSFGHSFIPMTLDKYDPKINSSPKKEDTLTGWEFNLKKYIINA